MLRVVAICAVALSCHLIVAADSDIIDDDYPLNETFVKEFTTTQPEREPSTETEEYNQTDIIDDDYQKYETLTEKLDTVEQKRKPRVQIEDEDPTEQNFCLRPPDIEGIISPILENEKHPLGTVISYQCKFGYVSRSSGSLLSICRIGKLSGEAEWTHPNTTCIPRSCGDPGYVVNGRRIGNLFTFPNSVTFECLEGYKLQGLKERYCQAAGEWSGRLPTCVPIYCPVPTNPQHGRVLYSSLDYGSELEYECDKGFILQNHQPRTCNKDGIWSNDEPECIETTCIIPEALENVSVQLSEKPPKVGTLAFYSCNDGATLIGASTSKCLSSGDWTFDPPKCLRSCYVPEIQDGELGRNQWNRRRQVFVSLKEGQSVKHHELVTLRCRDGYSFRNGRNGRLKEVECNDGAWSEPLDCRPTICEGQPPPVENASPVIKSKEHGSSIWYECDPGYGKEKSGKVICQYGKWEGPTPACADHRCYLNELKYPGLIKPATSFINHAVHFNLVCKKGYKAVSSSKTHVSCVKGKWDVTTNPCTIKSCEDDPPSIVKGQPTEFRRVNGSVVYYECEDGYELEGHSTVHCAFGTWEGNPPVCKTSVKNLERTTEKHLKNGNRTENPFESIPNSSEQNECFCTFDYKSDILVAYSKNLEIDSHHQIKKGESVLFICRHPNTDIIWPNGLRVHERTEIICDTCRDWQIHDLPWCETRDAAVKNSEATTEKHSKNESMTTNTLKSIPNSLEQEECFCTFEYRRDILVAYWKNFEIHSHHQIKKGERVLFICRYQNMNIVWPNGLRFLERIELTCDTCRDWQIRDLPSCEELVPGSSLIKYDINNPLKVLPRGIIKVPQSERISFTCINYWLPPQWNFTSMKGITVQDYPPDFVSGTGYYRQDIIIEEMDYEHIGSYECFAMNYGVKMKNTTMNLLIDAFDVLCPELSTETNQGSFDITYSNHRKVNSIAQYACKDPLKKIVGSNERECLENGKWSRNFPACEDIRCPVLNETNGFSITYNNNRKVNSEAFYYCDTALQRLIGSSNRTCLHTGEWSGTNPVCEDITCLEFPTYSGLSVTYSKGTKVGSIARFSCLNHASLIGSPVTHCLHNGTWSHRKPSCEMLEIRCPKIDGKRIFTILYSNSRKVNSTAQFFCKAKNKKVSGCNFVTCQQNGEWSGDYPTCVDYVSCELFDTSTNLKVRYTRAGQVGSIAFFQCLPPRYLIGNSSAECISNGIWSNSLPICAPPNCSIETLEESLPENLYINLENITDMSVVPGSELPLICDEHLVLTGRSKAVCNFHGKWEFSDAQCIPACRVNKEETSHLIVEPEKDYYRFGEFILLSCPPGLRLTSEVERMMCLGRTWSDTLPTCAELTEPNLPEIKQTTEKI